MIIIDLHLFCSKVDTLAVDQNTEKLAIFIIKSFTHKMINRKNY